MFKSMLDHRDLIFQDSTVRLVRVPPQKQNYEAYLETDFLRAMERMENIDKVTASAQSFSAHASTSLLLVLTVYMTVKHMLPFSS